MAADHDRSSGFLAGAYETALAQPGGVSAPAGPEAGASGNDPLSDVLRTVKLTGAMFFLVDATSPWCVDVPHARTFSRIVQPRARHIISYHIVVRGAGIASIPGHDPVPISAGDVIVFPHGDPYVMQSAPGVPPEFDEAETLQFFRDMAAGNLPFVVAEGGGSDPPAQFLCGFLGCEAHPFNPLLAALPNLVRVQRHGGGDLLDRLIEITLAEAQTSRAGGACIRLRLSELLFVEVIRRHLQALPASKNGWLGALADATVGRALALMHQRPAHPWGLDELARKTGASRSVLAERFTQLVGYPPMQYLTRWRMQIAAGLLSDGRAKVSAVGLEVGYASEAAFSRTFKRIAGISPSNWQKKAARNDRSSGDPDTESA